MQDHLLYNIMDILRHVNYFGSVAAVKGLDPKGRKSVIKNVPKPSERPVSEEAEEEEVVFTTGLNAGEAISRMLGQAIAQSTRI